jgi:hypothetical protein
VEVEAVHARAHLQLQGGVAARPAVAAVAAVDRDAVEVGAHRLLGAEVDRQLLAGHGQVGPQAPHAGARDRVPGAHGARQRRQRGLRVSHECIRVPGRAAQLEGLEVTLELADLPGAHAALGVVVAEVGLVEATGEVGPQAQQRLRDLDRQVEALGLGEEAQEVGVVVGQLAVVLAEVAGGELGEGDAGAVVDLGRVGRSPGRLVGGLRARRAAPRRAADQRLGLRPDLAQVEAGVGEQHAGHLRDRVALRGEAIEGGDRLVRGAQVQPLQVGQLERRGVVGRLLGEAALERGGAQAGGVGRERGLGRPRGRLAGRRGDEE